MNTRTPLLVSVLTHFALMLGAYGLLVSFFEFPDILREPPATYLALFQTNEAFIRAGYTAFTWSQVAFCVVALLIGEHLRSESTSWLRMATTLGVIAGLCQAIGFSRWVFVVPSLATGFEADPEMTLTTLDTLHRFAGVAVGEHLFFLFEALWAAALFLHFRTRNTVTSGRLRVLGVIATGIGLYALEQFGGPFAILGPVNVAAHAGLLLWLVDFSVAQFNGRQPGRAWSLGMWVFWLALVAPSWF